MCNRIFYKKNVWNWHEGQRLRVVERDTWLILDKILPEFVVQRREELIETGDNASSVIYRYLAVRFEDLSGTLSNKVSHRQIITLQFVSHHNNFTPPKACIIPLFARSVCTKVFHAIAFTLRVFSKIAFNLQFAVKAEACKKVFQSDDQRLVLFPRSNLIPRNVRKESGK